MKSRHVRALGIFFVVIGLLIAISGVKINFPGVEAIVGKGNVVFTSDGNYYFTSFDALIRWVVFVEAIALATCALGLGCLWSTRNRKGEL